MPIELSQGFRFGAFTAEPLKGSVAGDDGQSCHLAPKAMDVLVRLAEAAPKPVTRDDLITAVWGERYVSDEVLTHAIKELRHALGDSPTRPQYIQTIPKRGYRLLKKAQPIDDPTPARKGGKRRYLVFAASLALVVVACGWLVVNLARNAESTEAASEADEVTVSGITVSPLRRIVVLPFADLSPDGGQEYFSDGISEEILNQFAKVPGLRVISRQSAFSFKGQNVDIPTIAAKLDVSYVLEGSVRRIGDRVRITAQLIDAKDSSNLWAEAYDRDYSAENLIEIQSDIARAITGQLRLTLSGDVEARLARVPTENTEAYAAYLLGRQRLTDRRVDWLEGAIEQFAHAIHLDPDFGNAYSGLVDACALFASYSGGHNHESCPTDEAELLVLARKAVRLAPDSGEAWISLGGMIDSLISPFDDRHSKSYKELSTEAEDAFKRGISLNPSYSQGYNWYAQFLYWKKYERKGETWLAAWRDGVWWKVIEQGLEVDPLSLQLHGQAYFPEWVHSREESLWHLRRIVEIAPDSPQGYGQLGYYLWRYHGRADEMVRLTSKAARLDPRRPAYATGSGFAYMALGDYDMALAYFGLAESLAYTETNPERARAAGEAFALLYAGRTKEAIEKLGALQDTPWLGRPQLHAPLNALAGIDLRDGRPERALSRFRQHRPECFADVEFKDLSDSCPMLALARILQEVGDEERVQGFVLGYTPVLQKSWDYLWSHVDYRIEAFVRARYEAIAGRHEQALTMLEDLVAKGFRGFVTSEWDWRFFAYYDITLDSIRDHPRFRATIAIIEADMAQQLENVREMQRRGEVPTLEEVKALIASKQDSD